MNNEQWKAIFEEYDILSHDFKKPFKINSRQINHAIFPISHANNKEVRILLIQAYRESRPDIFVENDLFILPVKNGEYVVVKGEGYVDIPKIDSSTIIYKSKLDFTLDTSKVGNSEMQHLDYAYASSLIRTFLKDDSLVLTIRGRKYTPKFSFFVNNQFIEVKSVQTEVDAGYEGKNQIVLIEAKNNPKDNTIIRQLFYPFKQWKTYTKKDVVTLFFEKKGSEYSFWNFIFEDERDYNSIKLVQKEKFEIK